MKKIKLGLFPKVVIAILLGSLLGIIAPDVLVRILKTFNVFFAQILKFIVPLLVLGLVTPSVANLGRGAGKMLIAVMIISYISTVGAGLFSYGFATTLFPHYLEVGEIATSAAEGKTFAPFIELKIPPVCDILRLTQKGWSLFYIGCRRVVGRLRQSSASLHPPSGTSFLREPLTRPRPATLCRSLPATTQLTSLPVFQQQVPYFEPACAWTLLYKQHTS